MACDQVQGHDCVPFMADVGSNQDVYPCPFLPGKEAELKPREK